MPTKQTAPLLSLRAAAMVIISSAVYPFCPEPFLSGMHSGTFQALAKALEIRGAQNMALHPFLKGLALPRNRVPLLIEGVIAGVISLCVRRKGSALHLAD